MFLCLFKLLSFYLLNYVSHVCDVLIFLFLSTFIMYLDYHCFVYVVYVLFIALFHH